MIEKESVEVSAKTHKDLTKLSENAGVELGETVPSRFVSAHLLGTTAEICFYV